MSQRANRIVMTARKYICHIFAEKRRQLKNTQQETAPKL